MEPWGHCLPFDMVGRTANAVAWRSYVLGARS
jgi:hypothetical protein